MKLKAVIAELEEEYRQLGTALRFLRGRAGLEHHNGAPKRAQPRRRVGHRAKTRRKHGRINMLVRDELNTKPQPLGDIMKSLRGRRVSKQQVASALNGLRRAGHVEHSDDGWSIRQAM